MGRPPCCDEVGIKRGPWTPEEDIVLVAYVQEHGPRNWKSVPTNTGLMRCSKSCRLRWTNYLRPGIKRGNFTPNEERTIIRLQSLLGNRWATIASYLPQRTDNDIKNYWNTHLKKRIKSYKAAIDSYLATRDASASCQPRGRYSAGDSVVPGLHQTRPRVFNTSAAYASSTENISRLLEGWMRPAAGSTLTAITASTSASTTIVHPDERENIAFGDHHNVDDNGACSTGICPQGQPDSLFSFENSGGGGWENSYTEIITMQGTDGDLEGKQRFDSNQATMSIFDTWFLDEATEQMEGLMEQWQEQQ